LNGKKWMSGQKASAHPFLCRFLEKCPNLRLNLSLLSLFYCASGDHVIPPKMEQTRFYWERVMPWLLGDSSDMVKQRIIS
jgi:hypothetical protein